MGLSSWEKKWAPYDESTYTEVLAQIHPDDVVLDIGAGDLRLARRLADRAHRVYAVERQPHLLLKAPPAPKNLYAVCGDARTWPFPSDVTVGILLMRHCTHFRDYAEKLAANGCQRLITNARWGFGVETIDLQAPRIPFAEVLIGWYACWCGDAGFISGPAEDLSSDVAEIHYEVFDCPACRSYPANLERL